MKIYLYLLKNYFKLSKFLKIELWPFTSNKLIWQFEYKCWHNELNDEDRVISDKFCEFVKKVDGEKIK